jgi:hypothetical protein
MAARLLLHDGKSTSQEGILIRAVQTLPRTDRHTPEAKPTLRLVENRSALKPDRDNRRIAFGILAAAVLAVAILSLVFAVGESRRFSMIIDDAVAIAAGDARVASELGDDIAVYGPASRREFVDTTPMELRATVPVRGSLRRGHLHVVAIRDGDRWAFTAVILEAGRRYIDVTAESEAAP